MGLLHYFTLLHLTGGSEWCTECQGRQSSRKR